MSVEVPHPPACLPSYRPCPPPASYKDLSVNTLYYLIHPKLRIRIPQKTAPNRTGLQSLPQLSSLCPSPHDTSTTMIIRLGRLTPGYFRLLQRQVAGEVQTQPHDRSVNQIAMMLAIMGLSFSYYSAKQMTAKVQAEPAP